MCSASFPPCFMVALRFKHPLPLINYFVISQKYILYVGKGSRVQTVFLHPIQLPKNNQGPPSSRGNYPQNQCWAYHLVGEYLFLFQIECLSLVLLKCVYHLSPGQPHCHICLHQGRDSILCSEAQAGSMKANGPVSAAASDTLALGNQCHC